jgi:predicted Zn-dependent protease
MLYQLRAAENKMPGAEALLSRILRLDPNDRAATQALAALLFARGAWAEYMPRLSCPKGRASGTPGGEIHL